ncbi:MAG: hypothetical protein ACK5NG_06615 [Chthoniobacterales bacterium]
MRTRFLYFNILFFLLLLLSLASLQAQRSFVVPMQENSSVKIEAKYAFKNYPLIGYMPAQVSIENGSSEDFSYSVNSESILRFGQSETLRSENRIGAKSGTSVTSDFLLPLLSKRSNGLYSQFSVNIKGPFIASGLDHFTGDTSHGRNETPFIAMSQTLSAPVWTELSQHIRKSSKPFRGSPVDFLPVMKDWRAWIGIDALWMTPADYLSLSADLRSALYEWLLQGGILVFCVTTDEALPAGFSSDASYPLFVGFGQVRKYIWDGKKLNIDSVADDISKTHTRLVDKLSGTYFLNSGEAPGFFKNIGELKQPMTLLLIIMFLFAIAMGPLNLFWLAPVGKRHRLFFTVPLISLITSLLLAALILFHDGIGGIGSRVMLKLVDAENKRIITMQEQAAKTGLLLSRSFKLPESTFIAEILLRNPLSERNFTNHGNLYGGDWFASRSRQMHFLQNISSGREAIDLLNSNELANGATPLILSSIPGVLEELRWIDFSGQEWMASNVAAGQKTEMKQVDSNTDQIKDFVDRVGAGSIINTNWQRVTDRKGFFYAYSSDTPENFLPTLSSIRWNFNKVLWCGRITEGK